MKNLIAEGVPSKVNDSKSLVSLAESNEYRERNSKDFYTRFGLSLAANNLPLVLRHCTKLAGEASANVERKSKQKLFINLIGQSAVIFLT